MQKYLLGLLVLIAQIALAQEDFEGLLVMRMSTSARPDMGTTKMYYSEWGGRFETEIIINPNAKAYKTVRLFKKDKPDIYYILNENTESYSITDLSAFKNYQGGDATATVKVIGKEIVLGYECIHSIVTTKNGETELWTTKELIAYDSYKLLSESDARSRNSSFAKALIEANAEGFPVRMIRRDAKGSEIRLELIKVDRNKLSKNLFEIPKAYAKTESPTVTMEGMMKEIKQMGNDSIKAE